jgi:regulator of sirC expression with transglutaminase-like and TPR domain
MDPAERFARIVGGPPTPWSLDVVCSLLSAAFTHRLRTDEVLSELDDLADSCQDQTLEGVLAVMRTRLHGNADDYYDPRNSFIDEVLERGVGLPITLSVIAIEIGRRVGAPIAGIGPPRHFMVRDAKRAVFGDPFHDGAVYDRPALMASWSRLMGEEHPFDELHLVPLAERAILIRMLNNLRALYVPRAEPRALWALATMRGAFAELVHEAPEHARWMRAWN